MCSGEGPWILWVILFKSASGDEPPGPRWASSSISSKLLIGSRGFGPVPLVGGILFLGLLVLRFFNGSPDVGRLSTSMTSIDGCGWNKVSGFVSHPLYLRATLLYAFSLEHSHSAGKSQHTRTGVTVDHYISVSIIQALIYVLCTYSLGFLVSLINWSC